MKLRKRWLVVCMVSMVAGTYAANELAVSIGWTYNKGGRKRVMASATVNYDVSGAGVVENVQSISTNTAGTALIMGSVTNAGFAYFHNMDTNNAVEIGLSDGTNLTAFLKLNADEATTAWLATSTPYARAVATNNVSVLLDYVVADR